MGYLVVVAIGVFGPEPGGLLDRVEQGLRYGGRGFLAVLTGHPAAASRAGESLPGLWPFGDIGFENLANVALFVPLALAFPLLWPRWRWWTVPVGIGVSVGIELAQGLFLAWRTPSLEDVVSNSLGAVIGFSLWLAVRWLSAVGATQPGIPGVALPRAPG